MTKTKARLEREYDERLGRINEMTDRDAAERVRLLVSKLSFINIRNINMGCGTWSLGGPDFDVVYDDESEGQQPIQEIVYWLGYGKVWSPKSMTDAEHKVLVELDDLLNWWADTTGGYDLVFPGTP